MLIKRRQLIYFLILLIGIFFLTGFKLDYYIYQPGDIYSLNEVIHVEDGYESEGDMHMVTVRGGQATPVYYLWALIRPYYDIYPLHQIRPEGINQDEYMNLQLHSMETSQDKAMVVAYQAAGKDVTIKEKGVYIIGTVAGMPADEKLKAGDQVIAVEGTKVTTTEEVLALTDSLELGDKINLTIQRNEEQMPVEIGVGKFPDQPNRVGMGVSLLTDREIVVDPPVKVDTGKIGGPSAGLMMTLEMYDQLNEEDITKGYQLAGTGEIDYEGNIGRIGGIDKKVVASHRNGADIFFAPNEGGKENSNYEVAEETAKKIESDMIIVPVDTFEDAINYLEQLEPKEG